MILIASPAGLAVQMASDIASVRFRISSPGDIVAAVPYLVGFQPEDSFVVISLRGERRRIGLTARADLPPPEAADNCAKAFVEYLKRDKAAGAVLALYPPSGGAAHPSVRPLIRAIDRRFTAARIQLCEAVCVSDGRWWSMRCTDDACCPAEGTPVSLAGTSAYAAAATVSGRVVFGSRSELAGTIEPVTGSLHDAMANALPRERDEVARRLARESARGTGGRDLDVVAESLALLRAEIEARLPAPDAVVGARDLGADDAARLIAALDDVRVRDHVLTWHADERGVATRGLLVELVRRAIPPHQVAALTTFAWIAYLQGDGAIAGIALDKALKANPGYRLARLLDHALTNALDPGVVKLAFSAAVGLDSLNGSPKPP